MKKQWGYEKGSSILFLSGSVLSSLVLASMLALLIAGGCGSGGNDCPGCKCREDADCQEGQHCNLSTNRCEADCVPKTCRQLQLECGTASDGCGGTLECGGCPADMVCNQGSCVQQCTPSCAGKCCGDDGCGGTCEDNCGATEQTCDTSTCSCTGTCQPQTCAQLGKECGSWPDGCGGAVDCGTCSGGLTCNAQGSCVSQCQPQTCAQLGKDCGSWPDGCGGTVDCGGCNAGYECDAQGNCTLALPTPQLSLLSQQGQTFTLEWTYSWDGLAGSTDHYELEESTTSAGSGFNVVLGTPYNDRTSPWQQTLTRTPGTYWYRVRAFDRAYWSPYSNVVQVQVQNQPPILEIVNDLPQGTVNGINWTNLNQIIRVYITDTDNELQNCTPVSCNLLQLGTCSLPGDTIMPGSSMTFDVSQFADGDYWVFIECGWWDYTCIDTYCCWEEHLSQVLDCNAQCCVYKWSSFHVSNHFSGTYTTNASTWLPPYSWNGTSFCP